MGSMLMLTATDCPVCGETAVFWAHCEKCGARWCEGIDCGKRIDKDFPGERFCGECVSKGHGYHKSQLENSEE